MLVINIRDMVVYAVTGENIEQSFASTGWAMADHSLRHLLAGKSDNLWMPPYRLDSGTDNPVFEVLDLEWVISSGSA